MDILTAAGTLVSGDRQSDYGHPLDNWTLTANLVNAMLGKKLAQPLTAEDMLLVMLQVKIAREIHRPKLDNRVDIGGYTQALEMTICERQRRARHERRERIRACVRAIREAMRGQGPGDWSGLLWEMDQRAELQRLWRER